MKKLITLFLSIIIATSTLMGCEATIGSMESNTNNSMEMSYHRFSGQKDRTINVEGNLALDVNIESEQGKLNLTVTDNKDKVIFQKENLETCNFKIELPEKGKYHIIVEADAHKGSYKIEW